MNISTALILSTSEYLTEDMQVLLYDTKDEAVLRNLAKNRFLSPALKYRFIGNDRFLSLVLSNPQNDLDFLRCALESTSNEQVLMKFTTQSFLNKEIVNLLVDKSTPVVAYYLAKHPLVDSNSRIALFLKYSSVMGEVNQYSSKDFWDKFGDDPTLWEVVLDTITLKQCVLLRGVVRLVKDGLLEPTHVLNFLKRAVGEVEVKNSEDRNWFRGRVESGIVDEIENFALSIASLSSLDKNSLETIASYPFLTKARLKAQNSLNNDLFGKTQYVVNEAKTALDAIKCRSGLLGEYPNLELSLCLKSLVALSREYDVPTYELGLLAILNRESLDEGLVREVCELLRGELSRVLAKELYELGLYTELAYLAKYLTTIIVDELNLNEVALRRLSEEGVIDYNNKDYIKKYGESICSYFKPLYLIVSEPHLLAKILIRLEGCPRESRETALTLLTEWTGDLESLIEASSRLNIVTPTSN